MNLISLDLTKYLSRRYRRNRPQDFSQVRLLPYDGSASQRARQPGLRWSVGIGALLLGISARPSASGAWDPDPACNCPSSVPRTSGTRSARSPVSSRARSGQISSSVMLDINLAGGAFGAVDGRADLIPTTDTLERTSLDYYTALRSLMAQRRAALVREGREGTVTGPSGNRA
jgi:hypothetical protein